jgi:hypothetical protein
MKALSPPLVLLFYLGLANLPAAAATESTALVDRPKAAAAVLPEKVAGSERIYLLSTTNYPDSLPYDPPPPQKGWSSIRIRATQRSTSCEIVATDLWYVDKLASDGVITVATTNTSAGGRLIHGLPLQPGPVSCGVMEYNKAPPRRSAAGRSGSSVYRFNGHQIYVTMEESRQWVEVVYHDDGARQTLLRVSRASPVGTPERADIEFLGDLDRDGKPDLWLSLAYGRDARQELLLMSRDSAPGKLLRQVVRAGRDAS